MSTRRICYACDLRDDPQLIETYKRYHQPDGIWPEITQSIRDAGVRDMEIYLTGNRMFMIMETSEEFDEDRKAAMDKANPKVRQWEELMWTFQQALPWAPPGTKWIRMENIFKL